mmetsp:Transcript_41805/g.48295  ORF Transcript_41805/g.48295 Transcript_41805/m.48295 type:complete len:209 (-) Transcript_41805:5574-6200(-)
MADFLFLLLELFKLLLAFESAVPSFFKLLETFLLLGLSVTFHHFSGSSQRIFKLLHQLAFFIFAQTKFLQAFFILSAFPLVFFFDHEDGLDVFVFFVVVLFVFFVDAVVADEKFIKIEWVDVVRFFLVFFAFVHHELVIVLVFFTFGVAFSVRALVFALVCALSKSFFFDELTVVKAKVVEELSQDDFDVVSGVRLLASFDLAVFVLD